MYRFALVVVFLFLSSCDKPAGSSGSPEPDQAATETSSTEAPSPDTEENAEAPGDGDEASGESEEVATTAISATSSETQVAVANSEGAIAGANASFPPGFFATDTEITIAQGQSLGNAEFLAELELENDIVDQAAPAVTIASSAIGDATKEYSLALPLPLTSFSLAGGASDNLAVLFLVGKTVNHPGRSGLFTGDQVTIVDGRAVIKTRDFGTFQSVFLKRQVSSANTGEEVPTPPNVTSSNQLSFVSTVAKEYQLVNTGAEVTSCTITPTLPVGLAVTVKNESCAIGGTATNALTETSFALTAGAAGSATQEISLSLVVAAAEPPILAAIAAQNYVQTVAITPVDFANTGSAVVDCSVSPTLPAGLALTLSADTCSLSGTPTSASASATYDIMAEAADGSAQTLAITVAVAAAAPPVFADNVTITFASTVASTYDFANTGGASVSCNVTPDLPTGLSVAVVSDSCRISGTSASNAAETIFQLSSAAADTTTDTTSFQLTVNTANPPQLTDLADTTLVRTINGGIVAFTRNGSSGVVVSCSSNPALPTGVSLYVQSNTCKFSGAPTVTQSATTHTITGTAAEGSTGTATVLLTVVEPQPPQIADEAAQTLTRTVNSTIDFTNSGSAATNCTITPSLPSGLAIQTVGDTCRITGTPGSTSSTKTYTVTATAADNSKDTATIDLTVVAANPPLLANASAILARQNSVLANYDFVNAGSTPTDCSSSPALPAGLSVVVANETCSIQGTPTTETASATYTITGTGADTTTDTATIDIRVLAPVVAETKFTAASGATSEYFGAAVAISDNLVVIGTCCDSTNGSTAGAVYVQKYNPAADTWVQTKILASDGAAGDRFGTNVAAANDLFVVGGIKDKVYIYRYNRDTDTWDETIITGTINFASSLAMNQDRVVLLNADGDELLVYQYSYVTSSWVSVATLAPADGRKVAISGDVIAVSTGLTIIVYRYDPSDGLWVESSVTPSVSVAGMNFGDSIDVSGNYVIVGAPNDPTTASYGGAAFLFRYDVAARTWSDTKFTAPSPVASDYYGNDVSISGTRIVIGVRGDDRAYLYQLDSSDGTWFESSVTGPFSGRFAWNVAIQDDRFIVSDEADSSNTGAVYHYQILNQENAVKITAAGGETGNKYGESVAIDGQRFLIGASEDNTNAGAVYFGATLPQTGERVETKIVAADGEAEDRFGFALALDGDLALIGAYKDDDAQSDAGAAYLFQYDLSSNAWTQVYKFTPSNPIFSGDYGYSVALDGGKVVIGSHDAQGNGFGGVYIYQQDPVDGTWYENFLTSTGHQDLGKSVSVHDNKVLAGSPNGSGSAYVFILNPATNVWDATVLTAADGESGDQYGASVAVVGDNLYIGAPTDDDSASNAGAVYALRFKPADQSWVVNKLLDPAGANNDYFGYSVAAYGDNMLAGAITSNLNGSLAGLAFLFEYSDVTSAFTQTTLQPASPQGSQKFGAAVGLCGSTALVGADRSGVGTTGNRESAHLFDLN